MWWDGPMAGFDLETTSPEPEEARIVTAAIAVIAAAESGAERGVDAWQRLVNPGVEIPAEATEVHGVTNERAIAEGEDVGDVLTAILDAFHAAVAGGYPMVIYNARYDLVVLDRELRRNGRAPYAEVLSKVWLVDPLVVDKHLDRYRPKRVASHSLEDACRVWNATIDGAHDAKHDAMAACRLAWRLCRSGRMIRRARNASERHELAVETREWERVRVDLAALYEWQQKIAVEEAVRLGRYFAVGDPRKDVPPQPDRVVPTDWPIVPFGKVYPTCGEELSFSRAGGQGYD